MGFYKHQDKSLLYAPNFVCNKDFELLAENKDKYEYPVEGWYWFEDKIEAMLFFNIQEDEEGQYKEITGEIYE